MSEDARLTAARDRIADLERWKNTTTTTAHDYPLDFGDTAWILTCTCFVLLMTIPGLALAYAGQSKAGNTLSAAMQSFTISAWVTILWLTFGYSLSFGQGVWFIGGGEKFWFQGLTSVDGTYPLTGTIPETLFCIFQLTFAIIASAIITGASAERMKFSSLLVFTFSWHLLVYCPICHWVWGGGFMHTAYGQQGILDYAGGDVVHISAGVSALVVSMILGPRRGRSILTELPPHNPFLILFGGSFLWVGGLCFMAGSALSAGGSASMVLLTSQLAASAGGMAWMTVESLDKGKPSVLAPVFGANAGLVAIAPASGFVDQTGAFCIGAITGVSCYFGIQFKKVIGADDALDAFGVHGIGGMIGGILTGLFANPKVAGGCGALYGCGDQLGWQIAGVLTVTSYSATVTAIIMIVLKYTVGIRVSAEGEDMGLDAYEHGWEGGVLDVNVVCRSRSMARKFVVQLFSGLSGEELDAEIERIFRQFDAGRFTCISRSLHMHF